MNVFERVVLIVIALGMLFLIPTYWMAENTDRTIQSYVLQETARFTDAIKNNGYVTEDMYLEFAKEISQTGNIYEIEMVVEHPQVQPVYSEDGTFQEEISIIYLKTYTDEIRKALFEGEGIYRLSQGDFLSVTVYNKNDTMAAAMRKSILPGAESGVQIYATYGGEVRDENY